MLQGQILRHWRHYNVLLVEVVMKSRWEVKKSQTLKKEVSSTVPQVTYNRQEKMPLNDLTIGQKNTIYW